MTYHPVAKSWILCSEMIFYLFINHIFVANLFHETSLSFLHWNFQRKNKKNRALFSFFILLFFIFCWRMNSPQFKRKVLFLFVITISIHTLHHDAKFIILAQRGLNKIYHIATTTEFYNQGTIRLYILKFLEDLTSVCPENGNAVWLHWMTNFHKKIWYR